MQFTIDVTIDDILTAIGNEMRYRYGGSREYNAVTDCPIALAASRAFGAEMHANASTIHFASECGGGGEMRNYPVPDHVRDWQSRFDKKRWDTIDPITFTVTLFS